MRQVETYRWRVQWLGRWTTTRHHTSEEDIRVEHPEAVAVPGSLIVLEVPETDDEREALNARITFGRVATPAPGMPPLRSACSAGASPKGPPAQDQPTGHAAIPAPPLQRS